MKSMISRSTALVAVLFFFTASGLTAAPDKEQVVGGLLHKDIEITSIIEAFSKQTGKVIVPNQNILQALKNQKATIILPNDLRNMEQNAELWDQIFQNILSIYGYTMIKKGDIYRLVPNGDIKKMPVPIVDAEGYPLSAKSERIVTQVIKLKFVQNIAIAGVSQYIALNGGVYMPLQDKEKKTIIVTASESDLKYFMSLIQIFDVPDDTVFTFQVYVLKRAIPSLIKTQVESYLTTMAARDGGAAKAPTERPFIALDDGTNRLLVSATPDDHKSIAKLIEFFDADIVQTHAFKPIEIYRLKNSNAESVAKKLDQVLKSKQGITPSKDPNKKEDIPTIVPFEQLNALIISVEEPDTFRYIKEVIDMLDVKRNQVYIASTIVEVNKSKGFNFGLTFGAGSAPNSKGSFGVVGGADLGGAGTFAFPAKPGERGTVTPNVPKDSMTLAFPYGGYDFIPLVLRAAETDSDISVLANPSIICDDNEHAVIEITEERQFNTTTFTGSSQTNSSFGGFNNAGIVLDIKPTISSDSFLKLELTQNVDRFLSDPGADQVRNKRKATTVVTIPNKTSVVIGGLTENNLNKSHTGIPFLSKIPLLGELFKSRNNSEAQKTLYFFITPEIIINFDELAKISDRLHDRMAKNSSPETRADPIFQDARNDKTGIFSAEQKKVMELLMNVFTRRSLSKWLKPEQAKPLSLAIIEHRVEAPGLLPEYSRVYFDETKLDSVFQDTLLSANAQLEKLAPEQRLAVQTAFNQYLITELQFVSDDIPRHDMPADGKPHDNIIFKSDDQ